LRFPVLQTNLDVHQYAGYFCSHEAAARRLYQHYTLVIPTDFCFRRVSSLSHEMIERLERVRPENFGQARQIPGLSQAALSNLLVSLSINERNYAWPFGCNVSRETHLLPWSSGFAEFLAYNRFLPYVKLSV